MTTLSEEEKKYLKYQIYSFRYDDPWIPNKKIAKLVNRPITTVDRYAKLAVKEGVIWGPSLGLIHPDRRVALLLFDDKWKGYKALQEYENIGYVCVCQGDWDIMTIQHGEVDFSHVPGYKKTVIEGSREKVFTPRVKYTTWEKSFKTIETLIEEDEPLEKSILTCDVSYPDWDEEDWKLFDYFRPNVRKKFSVLRREHLISWRKYIEWKKSLRECCTIMVEYYPEGDAAYDNITFCFRTDYEKYIVELLSTLPSTCFVYKVREWLLANVFVPPDYSHQTRLYEIVSQLLNKNIVTEYMDAHNIAYSLRSDPEE